MIVPDNTNLVKAFKDGAQPTGSFFTGVFNTRVIDGLHLDPFITGYSFILWTKIPEWMEKLYPEKQFQNLTQKNFKAFSEISDIELNTVAHNQGFANNEYHVASNITKGNTSFSITAQEMSGSPIRQMYTSWVTGIRDPETGIATYPKLFNLEYRTKNHVGELLYVVTRPDVTNIDNNIIEFACFYTAVMPRRIPLSHLNYTQGTNDLVEIEMPFVGVYHQSPDINKLAKEKLKELYFFETMSDWNQDKFFNESATIATTGPVGDNL